MKEKVQDKNYSYEDAMNILNLRLSTLQKREEKSNSIINELKKQKEEISESTLEQN